MKIFPVTNKKDLNRFIKFPFQLYRHDPFWIPPLIMDQKNFFNPEKNPYYKHSEVQLFLAEDRENIVGRISAHTNTQHNNFHDDKVGFFGFFEALDSLEVAQNLLDTATSWLKEKGCNEIRGPFNFSTNDECALLVKGFDSPPFVMMPHNKDYYEKLILQSGFSKIMDFYAYLLPVTEPSPRLAKLTERLEKRGNFTIRSLAKNKKQRRKDLETVFHIYTRAWERNWGFVPMTPEEFDHTVDTLLPIALPELILIAEVKGEPAGFSVALPDYNLVLKKMKGHLLPFGLLKALYFKNKISRLRVITMGVIKEFQNRGIDVAFYHKSYETAYHHKQKFIVGEISWILEINTMMNRIAHSLGGDLHKIYRTFNKKIN